MTTRPKIRSRRILPGFGLTLGCSMLYLTLIVLIPLAGVFVKSTEGGWDFFWQTAFTDRAMASYRLSFGASLIAALINAVFGLLTAWVLVRYRFPGKRLVDSMVDLPFALPTAVAGIALTAVYTSNGWIGKLFAPEGPIGSHFPPDGIPLAYTEVGVVIALTFIGLPFVVRTIQPVLEDLNREAEEAAASLGANRWQMFSRVIFPELRPALLTGFALAFARAVGEYGSVIFIAGNIPYKTEITPLLIYMKLEEFNYDGAAVLAVVMLVASFVLLLLINGLQWWSSKFQRAAV